MIELNRQFINTKKLCYFRKSTFGNGWEWEWVYHPDTKEFEHEYGCEPPESDITSSSFVTLLDWNYNYQIN